MATTPMLEGPALNVESQERQAENPNNKVSKQGSLEKTTTQEITEKIKTPTIGVSLIVFLIINVIMFIVGVATTKDCPIQPIIPIYLAVAGALGAVTKIIPIANRNKRIVLIDRIVCALFVLELVWMILGSYWIYSIYAPNYVSEHGPYCNKTAYLLAFWLLTLNYISLLLLLLIPCCIVCCFCCFALIASSSE